MSEVPKKFLDDFHDFTATVDRAEQTLAALREQAGRVEVSLERLGESFRRCGELRRMLFQMEIDRAGRQ